MEDEISFVFYGEVRVDKISILLIRSYFMAKKNSTTAITFDEIKDNTAFEELVAAYFRNLFGAKTKVSVIAKGSDGGRDIVVTFTLTDTIDDFTRTWVVQCKFWRGSVGTSLLSDVNIPTLIHQYGAVGYLLVLKHQPTTPLRTQFEELRKNCIFGYRYEIWTGSEFISKLYDRDDIHQQYFPRYHAYKQKTQQSLNRIAEKS